MGINFTSSSKGNKTIVNKGPHKGQANVNMNRNQPRFKFPNESNTNEQYGRTEVETMRPLVQCWG